MASRKELLKSNLDELNKKIGLELSIKFKSDEFIVLDKDKNILMRSNINNYDYTLEGQIKFINDVGSKALKYFKNTDNMEYDKVFFYGRSVYYKYFDYFMLPVYSIKTDKKVTFDMLDKINKLDWNIKAGYDCNNTIYIGFKINEAVLTIYFDKSLFNTKMFFYSNYNNKELDNAIKTIKELVK